MKELKSILTSREALYERAQHSLDTSGKTLAQSQAELLDLLHANGLCD
jgi:XRE family aerobic/anaerobic benzoate catabolism transcriptional regulator